MGLSRGGKPDLGESIVDVFGPTRCLCEEDSASLFSRKYATWGVGQQNLAHGGLEMEDDVDGRSRVVHAGRQSTKGDVDELAYAKGGVEFQ